MSKRKRHPHKEIEKVVAYAESLGWRVAEGSGHAWAYLYCPERLQSGRLVSAEESRESRPKGAPAGGFVPARVW